MDELTMNRRWMFDGEELNATRALLTQRQSTPPKLAASSCLAVLCLVSCMPLSKGITTKSSCISKFLQVNLSALHTVVYD
ncbi:hypothetical protein GOP47_0006174 [Adiantum capillus-veneris]|uniref:Uncharacterized protein n=1 Tax=Adiantum capillus-veneris TaxID=13818 RepID=A0A9D4ZK25_ADICA|nr:hypothetical protein GOP47_0006174 [Adiantum capillus-veneris]